jgi:hypothetical protein
VATPLSLPLPPQKNSIELKTSFVKGSEPQNAADSKVATLRAYRMARGLCKFCAEKYVKGHKCSPTLSLHVVQEIWDLFQMEEEFDSQSICSDQESQINLILSKEAISPGGASRTLKFLGDLQGTPIIILIDSGCSHSFVNDKMTPILSGLSGMSHSVMVQVANGQIL